MNILIANVGRAGANEIGVLVRALNKKHRVTVACMAVEGSFKGQAFSYTGVPVRVHSSFMDGEKTKAERVPVYECYGEPADAVSIMLGEIMAHDRPDLVIAGIGNGVHMGQDIFCSSNIGMAMEAAYFNVPSISIAIPHKAGSHSEQECETAIKFLDKNLDKIAALKLPKHSFLNINIPNRKYEDLKGVMITRMGWIDPLINEFEEKVDHRGNKYYWSKLVSRNAKSDEGTDVYGFAHGYVSVTPINYDPTDYAELDRFDAIAERDIPKPKLIKRIRPVKKEEDSE